jgi:hypothetical protein
MVQSQKTPLRPRTTLMLPLLMENQRRRRIENHKLSIPERRPWAEEELQM